MKDFEEFEIWDKYPHHRKWMNKLFFSEQMNYRCGPGGYAPGISGYYVVRPVYNLVGMGVGASVKYIKSYERSSVPPGYFWCEFLSGDHYSITYEFDYNNDIWRQLSCWKGENNCNELYRFTRWTRSDFKPDLPEIFKDLKDVEYINIEFKNSNPIEIHLRPSGNPDSSTETKYNEFIPIWRDNFYDIECYQKSGYNFIERFDQAEGFLKNPRIGFMVK